MKGAFIILFLVILTFLACDKSSNSSQPDTDPERLFSPYPDQEVEYMTLWYGDSLMADYNIYSFFKKNLDQMRQDFYDSIPQVLIEFQLPYVPGELFVAFGKTTKEEIRSGTYTAWDSLNNELGIAEIDTSYFAHSDIALLKFNKIYNSKILVNLYRPLDGIWYAQVNGFPGDWSNIYPGFYNHDLIFLIREAWGECASGCNYSHFFYFKNINGTMKYIGDWNTETDGDQFPDWWNEVGDIFKKKKK